METNSFGRLLQFALAGWSLWCMKYFADASKGLNLMLASQAEREAAAGGALIGTIGSWLVLAVPVVILFAVFGRSHPNSATKAVKAKSRWKCEECGAYLDPNAPFCPSCGETPKPTPAPTIEKACSACFAKIDARATRCRFCTAEQPAARDAICPSCGAALGANTRSCPKCEATIGA